MPINPKKLEEMAILRDNISEFIKDVSTPIKKEHSGNIERYLDKFIKFPGTLSIVSIFFVNSNLVQNHNVALFGIVLIILSLIIALNVFRVS